jgi:hypothetical protein
MCHTVCVWHTVCVLWLGSPRAHVPRCPCSVSSWRSQLRGPSRLPGDGWSARLEDAVLHGCIPVIIIDNVHVV